MIDLNLFVILYPRPHALFFQFPNLSLKSQKLLYGILAKDLITFNLSIGLYHSALFQVASTFRFAMLHAVDFTC